MSLFYDLGIWRANAYSRLNQRNYFSKTRLMISNPILETLFHEIPGVKIYLFFIRPGHMTR